MTVRCTRVELLGLENREQWLEMSRQVQHLQNYLWREWLVYHHQNRSADKIRNALEKKERVDFYAVDSDWFNAICRSLKYEFPAVQFRVATIVSQRWRKDVTKKKASRGVLPKWMAILLSHESIPNFTKPQPILFDTVNGKVYRDGKNQVLEVSIQMESRRSIKERLTLRTNNKKAASCRTIVDQIIAGERKMMGSAIVFRDKKWFALISYAVPKKEDVCLDSKKTLHLIPGKKCPWIAKYSKTRLRFNAGNASMSRVIENGRRYIEQERQQRKEAYRTAGSSRKGRGRNRAISAWTKLNSNWNGLVNNHNHKTTTKLIQFCIARGIGRIVYHQPMSEVKKQRCFLVRAGMIPGSHMTWNFFQVGSMLSYKGNEYGITVEIEKHQADEEDNDDRSLPNMRNSTKGKSGRRTSKKDKVLS